MSTVITSDQVQIKGGLRLRLLTVALLDDGCFSVLLWDGRPFAVSVERTFDSGYPIICGGMYQCRRDYYHKGKYETFEILVNGHDRVLFHKGNIEDNSLACVCIAEKFGTLDGKLAVLESNEGFTELMKLTEGLDTFNMEVTGR